MKFDSGEGACFVEQLRFGQLRTICWNWAVEVVQLGMYNWSWIGEVGQLGMGS